MPVSLYMHAPIQPGKIMVDEEWMRVMLNIVSLPSSGDRLRDQETDRGSFLRSCKEHSGASLLPIPVSSGLAVPRYGRLRPERRGRGGAGTLGSGPVFLVLNRNSVRAWWFAKHRRYAFRIDVGYRYEIRAA
jgi:hypothetical protein